MSEPDYDPLLYDLTNQGSLGGDREWYLGLAKAEGGPVLELGAGTGRTLLPLARAGLDVTALDASPVMLAALRAKLQSEPSDVQARVQIIQADMRSFALEERFALIQIPFRALLHCVARADQLACLRCCQAHLRAGGLLAFNVFHPSLDTMSRNRGSGEGVWRWTGDTPHPAGGIVASSECSRFDTVRQIVHARLRHEHFAEDGTLLSTHEKRLKLAYLYPGDLRDLLAEAGFRDVRIDGDYEGGPLDRDGGELAVRARRA